MKANPEAGYRQLVNLCERLAREEDGQDLVEYGLLAALVALAAIVSVKSLGSALASSFSRIQTTFTSAV